MKLIELLQEAPVADYQTFSDEPNAPATTRGWGSVPDPDAKKANIFKHPEDFAKRSSSFTHKSDRTLLTNPKAVQRMKNMFANTEFDFHFYMVNTKEARHYTEEGLVDRTWLKTHMPSIESHIPDNPDGITVIFTNNKGAERVAMTPWIMAHRIGHALNRKRDKSHSYQEADRLINRTTDEIFNNYYNYKVPNINIHSYSDYDLNNRQKYSLLKKKFYEAIGTFRSARNEKLRADFEFLNEVFAQWLITKSGIRLNPVPKKLITRKAWGHDSEGVYGRGDEEYANQLVQDMAEELGYIFYNMMSEAIGKIYVM